MHNSNHAQPHIVVSGAPVPVPVHVPAATGGGAGPSGSVSIPMVPMTVATAAGQPTVTVTNDAPLFTHGMAVDAAVMPIMPTSAGANKV